MSEHAKEINTVLDSYHSTTLWEMAAKAGLAVTDSRGKRLRKTDLIAKMRAGFFTEARIKASWETLDRRERAIVNRLLLRGGSVSTKSFRREVLRARLATTARSPGSYRFARAPYADGYSGHPLRPNSRAYEDMVAGLTYRGLVFSRDPGFTSGGTPYKIQFHPGATLYIPKIVQQFLPQPTPVSDDVTEWKPARVETGEPTLLLRDLYLYWDFVRRNDVPLIQTGFVGKRTLKAINQLLLAPDTSLANFRREDEARRLYLLRQLLESLRLVHKDRGYLRPVHDKPLPIPEFWKQTPVQQLSICLKAWLTLEIPVNLGNNASNYGPRYAQALDVVLSVVKSLPPHRWFEIEDLLERVQEQNVDFLFAEHSRVMNYHGSWYYGYSSGYYYGHPKELLNAFDRFETEFVTQCLTGFLFQLGIVELGYGATGDGSQPLFRLSPTGCAIVDAKPDRDLPQLEQGEIGKLVIQPNFQLFALGPVSLAILARLDLFADREAVDRGAFQYRLSRESFYRAQRCGLEISDVIRFLVESCGTELPQNVRRSMEEWTAQYEQIVFRSGVSLLQAADRDLLYWLSEDHHTGQHLAREVTPEVALLKTKRETQLISALVAQGLFPAVSGSQPEAARQSVIIHQDGTIHSVHAIPSLQLRGQLSRLAEEITPTEWRLTAASVRRAGGSKNKVMRLLDELHKLHRGVFPEQLADQIKAWGGYYGKASSENLTLVEFRDQATLAELREHPALRAALKPFPAGDRALASIPDGKLIEVKNILAGFGINIKDGLSR